MVVFVLLVRRVRVARRTRRKYIYLSRENCEVDYCFVRYKGIINRLFKLLYCPYQIRYSIRQDTLKTKHASSLIKRNCYVKAIEALQE